MYLYQASHALRSLFATLTKKLDDPKFVPSDDTVTPLYEQVEDKKTGKITYEPLPVDNPSATLEDLLALRNKLTEVHNGFRAPYVDRRAMRSTSKIEAALIQNRPIGRNDISNIEKIRTYS